jgi:hypothetical protein
MFEQYCIDVLRYIEKNGTIRTEQILDKLGIPTKYAEAINNELSSNGWTKSTKSGQILKPSGSAYLAKLELSNPKQPHEIILEYLKPHGIGKYEILNPILLKLYSLTDKHDSSQAQKVTREIKDLLNGMESNNLIQLDPTKFNHLGSGNTSEGYKWLDTTIIKASIKTPGLDLLKKEHPKSFGDTIINTGTIIQNSPISHSSVSSIQDNSVTSKQATNINPNKKQKKSLLEILSWIVGIIVGLIALYEFVLKKFFINN